MPGGFPVTDDQVDAIVREFRAAASADIDRQAAFIAQRLRAFSAQAVARPDDQPELIPLGEAAKLARLSKCRMRALCALNKHQHGSDDGFGYKRGGRWHVVDNRAFRDWLRRRASV
jgi:hypothetical protein